MSVSPARWAAFKALGAVLDRRAEPAAALERARAGLADPRDRALAAELVSGTLRWLAAIDHVIVRQARRPLERIQPAVLNALRLGAYQLLYLTRIPPRAAVDEAVETVRRAGAERAAGFVNAVLRRVAVTRAEPPWPPRPDPSRASRDELLDYLAITLSYPRWLAARRLDRFGFTGAEAWIRFDNTPAPITLRANRLRVDRDALAAALAAEGIETRPARYAPDGLIVTSGNPLRSSLASRGFFVVQDEASQLIAHACGARPGERVLDACAAPGGKTLGLVADMEDQGLVVAADVRPRRLDLLRRTLEPLGARSVRLVRLTLLQPMPCLPVFDCVLVDAPCSGLGTLRRDPDVKWRRGEADLPRFAEAQLGMLRHAAEAVRPGGRLIYATCSSEPEENDDVIERFLATQPVFRPAPIVLPAPAGGLPSVVDDRGRLRTLPHIHGLEAFFAAALVKDRETARGLVPPEGL
ncbi:MAG TPA: 16S rRNA (cytosine(967)-C(5))-methyltransferase RsmB [Vicinamibacterales bacterium]|nr:16S rRNA (cytosine(967)-C(5))-methyltransferase RsmB [Vicinamibacterales bacterium]